MLFRDCPVAVTFERSGHCSMLDCTVLSTGQKTQLQAGVIVGDPVGDRLAVETYIADCLLLTNDVNAGQTGIAVYNSEHLRVMNTRIEAFAHGVVLKPRGLTISTYFGNVSIRQASGSEQQPTKEGGALVVQPQDGGVVQEAVFAGCDFAPTDHGTFYTLGGIHVDATQGSIDVLRFVSCSSIGWPGPGLEIQGGTNIEVQGGEYASNGRGSADLDRSGISIAGATSSHIRVVGASCAGTAIGLAAQDYGIRVFDGARHVLIRSCDISGNAAYGLFIGKGSQGIDPSHVFVSDCDLTENTNGAIESAVEPGANVQVVKCPGYNDLNTRLNGGAAPTGALSAAECSPPYFGPSLANFAHDKELNVHISGKAYMMKFGSLYLARALDRIYFEHEAPSNFAWLGK